MGVVIAAVIASWLYRVSVAVRPRTRQRAVRLPSGYGGPTGPTVSVSVSTETAKGKVGVPVPGVRPLSFSRSVSVSVRPRLSLTYRAVGCVSQCGMFRRTKRSASLFSVAKRPLFSVAKPSSVVLLVVSVSGGLPRGRRGYG